MNKLTTESESFCKRSAKTSIHLLIWVFVWTATMVLIDKASLFDWISTPSIYFIAILANVALGIGMILAYLRHLKNMDELQRKIQFDALAFGMGAGLVGGFTYSLLASAGFIADAEASDVILIMCLAYMAANIVGQVRFR